MTPEQAAVEFPTDLVIEIGLRKNIDLETNEDRGEYLIARLRQGDQVMRPSLGTTTDGGIDESMGLLCLALFAMRRASFDGKPAMLPAEVFQLP